MNDPWLERVLESEGLDHLTLTTTLRGSRLHSVFTFLDILFRRLPGDLVPELLGQVHHEHLLVFLLINVLHLL